jgi:hypothetical protein
MENLRQAQSEGSLAQFIADHEGEEGDEALFNATLAAMAGTSKAVQEASPPPHCDG